MNIDALWIIGAPILRSVGGWLNHALRDNKISLIEWKQLFQTILKLGIPAVFIYYGFKAPAELAAAIPLLGDILFGYIKKIKK